jgi:hypothetical protein
MNQPSENPASLLFGESAGLQTEDNQAVSDPLFPLMCHGLPNFAQIVYKIKAPPSASQPPPGTPPAGDDQELQRPLTRYAVDFVITIQESQLREDPGGFT